VKIQRELDEHQRAAAEERKRQSEAAARETEQKLAAREIPLTIASGTKKVRVTLAATGQRLESRVAGRGRS
jgi:hypothetical protein